MFFLLRCIFWLGLVFWHLDWSAGSMPAGSGRTVAVAGAGTQVARQQSTAENTFAPVLRGLAKEAGARAQDWCATRPSDCIGALISAAGAIEGLDASRAGAPSAPSGTARPATRPGPRASAGAG